MLEAIKKLFSRKPKTDFRQWVKEGAIILDVRSKGEYAGGHIPGSVNIPVDQLSSKLSSLKNKKKPIICCCASGMRSASATRILKSNGYEQVVNGGGWSGLYRKLN